MAPRIRTRTTQRFRDLALASRGMTQVTFNRADEISSAVGLMKAVKAAVEDYKGDNDLTKWRRIMADIAMVARDYGVDIDPKALRELEQTR